MKLVTLIQVAVVALATSAAPLTHQPDNKDLTNTHHTHHDIIDLDNHTTLLEPRAAISKAAKSKSKSKSAKAKTKAKNEIIGEPAPVAVPPIASTLSTLINGEPAPVAVPPIASTLSTLISGEPAPVAVPPIASTLSTPTQNLLPLLDSFVMLPLTMQPGGSSQTNNLSPEAVERALNELPPTITVSPGTFDPTLILEQNQALFLVDDDFYVDVDKDLDQNKRAQPKFFPPVDGEINLSGRLHLALSHPLGRILSHIMPKRTAHWDVRGSGSAPVEDWTFRVNSITKAVLELKTPAAMSTKTVDMIMAYVNSGSYRMAPMRDAKSKKFVNSLIATSAGKRRTRGSRETAEKAMEQVMSEIFYTKSLIGVLTNAEDWLVIQRDSVHSTDMSVTRINSAQADGKSRALEIMLAISLSA